MMETKEEFCEAIVGRILYTDHDPLDEDQRRIVIPVVFGDEPYPTLCIVDTGAPYCVLEPETASSFKFDPSEAFESIRLIIRGIEYFGYLYHIPITLEAFEGEPLAIDGSVFVPELKEWQAYPFPSFLGLQGFLDRIRFAVDPTSNSFFFGPL